MRLATETLHAIEEAMVKDQGARYRGLLRELMPQAEDAYREQDDGFRAHLGASLIGRECARELWYTFHWARRSSFDGKTLRLFNRGHLEEPRMIALLRLIGCEVWQHERESTKQFRIEGHCGHYGGSLDAVVCGIPEMPSETILAEFKTHGSKSFAKLQESGVATAKWEHFVQMQQYMGFYKLPAALYLAVNKDTDHLHAEIIQFDQAVATRYWNRAFEVINAKVPPVRISTSPGFFKCKFCDYSSICHLKWTPERNCRTCEHSRVSSSEAWTCAKDNRTLSTDDQRIGCSSYSLFSNP